METVDLLRRYCLKNGLRIATAESCTGGRIAAFLTEQAGASAYFASGVVCYNDFAKAKLLDVSQELLERYTAVSVPVTECMARSVAKLLDASVGLATTGYFGPTVGNDGTPVGTVYIAIHIDDKTEVHQLLFSGSRASIAEQTVGAAIELLWNRLKHI